METRKHQLITVPNHILREKAEYVTSVNNEIIELVDDMIEILKESTIGIGLAANQVGVPKRIIIIKGKEQCKVFLNPEILQLGTRYSTMKEGCLSIPGIIKEITRPHKIKFKFDSLLMKSHIITYEGLLGRAVQHEIDHLNGKLIIDYIQQPHSPKSTLVLENI